MVTTNFREGYLRKNGVPYSETASITEYFHRLPDAPNGDVWLHVVTIVEDPEVPQRAVLHEHAVQARARTARSGLRRRAAPRRRRPVRKRPRVPPSRCRAEFPSDCVHASAEASLHDFGAKSLRGGIFRSVVSAQAEPLAKPLDRDRRADERALREAPAARDDLSVEVVGALNVQAVGREVLEPEAAIGIERGLAEPAGHVGCAARVSAEEVERRVESDLAQRARDALVARFGEPLHR